MSCLPSEGQAALAGAVGQGRDATVVLVARSVEDDAVDAGSLRPLGDELADLPGLVGLVVARTANVGLHRGGRGQRLADEVVDDLHADVLGRPGDHQARTLGGPGDLLASPDLALEARPNPAGGVLV